MTDREELIETLQEVLAHFDRAAELLRGLGDPRVDAYCLAPLEGRGGGWMGTFARDVVEQALTEARGTPPD